MCSAYHESKHAINFSIGPSRILEKIHILTQVFNSFLEQSAWISRNRFCVDSVIGNRNPRLESKEQVTGRLKFTDDIYYPDMLYMKGLYSTEDHAKILTIDTYEAEKLSGVAAALTHLDVPNNVTGFILDDEVVLASDLLEGGINREDTMEFAKALENAGLSYLDLQVTGTYETFHSPGSPGSPRCEKDGQFDISVEYKKVLNIPVTTRTTGENNPKVWDESIASGMADAIRVGRAHLPDTELPNKVLAGQLEDIRDCIRCTACHKYSIIGHKGIRCSINAGAGNCEPVIAPANQKKNVLVIGGGPGGLEAARVSALRGHKVTLVEKKNILGGNHYIGSLPIAKHRLTRFITWAEHTCKKLGVDIQMNTEADAAYVEKMKPDVVFIATGSAPDKPPIPGINGENVIFAEDVLLNPQNLGKHVVVLGGGEVGLETTDFILHKGLADKVTLVEMLDDVGMDMNPMQLGALFEAALVGYLGKGILDIHKSTTAATIIDKGVGVYSLKTHKPITFDCDKVVVALGYKSKNELAEPLANFPGTVYVIGDAAKPANILSAVHQAYHIASEI